MTAPLCPTEREAGVFYWLWMLRVLTLDQILRLQYYRSDAAKHSSRINLRKRLRALEAGGYLEGLPFRNEGKLEKVYYLGPAALSHLARYGIGQKRLYTPCAALAPPQLLHPLMVSECAVCVVESLRGTSVITPGLAPFEAPFYGTHVVENPRAKQHVKRFLTQEDVQAPGRRLRIRPDLVFALRLDDTARLYFLEADRGLEGARILAEKLEAYKTFFNLYGPLWMKYHPAVRDARVLVVFDTPQRAGVILRSLPDGAVCSGVSFAALPSLQRCNAVFDPIWMEKTSASSFPLIQLLPTDHPHKCAEVTHDDPRDL